MLFCLSQQRCFADGKKSDPVINLPPPSSSSTSTLGSSILTEATKTDSNAPISRNHDTQGANSHGLFEPPNLPSAEESRRSLLAKRLSHLMENVQGNIFVASQRLNDLTGYSGIEALKERITVLEETLEKAQEDVRSSRQHYKQTIADRAASQREVNNLLSRKETWSPADVERFTTLYRSDHSNELGVQEAASKLADAERAAEQAASRLSASILNRYHEEQIWSDKIRRMSTWGTWGLMGVNVLLFLVFQFGFEPWRRARLVRGFEEKVAEALEKEKLRSHGGNEAGRPDLRATTEPNTAAIIAAGIEELEVEATADGAQHPVEEALAACMEGDAGGTEDPSLPLSVDESSQDIFDWQDAESWRQGLQRLKRGIMELFSERVVVMTQHDKTVLALEGAATGAGVIVMLYMLLANAR